MSEKKGLFQKIKAWWFKGIYMTNNDAAATIKKFVVGADKESGWDDFESVNHTNPDVDLAIELCWFFAGEFPAKKPKEYCDQRANVFFLKVADALESNQFNDLDHGAIKESLKKNEIPNSIRDILSIKDYQVRIR